MNSETQMNLAACDCKTCRRLIYRRGIRSSFTVTSYPWRVTTRGIFRACAAEIALQPIWTEMRMDQDRVLGRQSRLQPAARSQLPETRSLQLSCEPVAANNVHARFRQGQSRPPAQAHIKGLKVRQRFRLGENECLGTREQFVTVDNKLLAARHDGMLSSTATGWAGR